MWRSSVLSGLLWFSSAWIGTRSGWCASPGGVDERAPFVRLLAPEEGQILAGRVTITVEVRHEQPIYQVVVAKDGQVLATDVTSPYRLEWDTRADEDRSYVLSAKAIDVSFREGHATPVRVTVDNTPPKITLRQPAQEQLVAGPLELAADASDLVGVRLVRFLIGGRAVGEVSAPPYTLLWDSAQMPNGRVAVEARAIDLAGNDATTARVLLRISNLNHHPLLEPIAPQVVREGELLSVALRAHDADGPRDPVTFQIEGLPDWAQFDAARGMIAGTPGSGVASINHPIKVSEIRVMACDPEPMCDTESFTITVTQHNHPPTIVPIEEQRVREQSPMAIDLRASDPDGDPITCRAQLLPSWAQFDEARCHLWGTPGLEVASSEEPELAYPGVYLEACDAEQLCEGSTFTITVTDGDNRPPVIEPVSTQTLDEGKRLNLTIRATDHDQQPVTLTATPLPDGAVFEDRGHGTATLVWVPRADQGGTYQIALVASDGSLRDVKPLTVVVRERQLAISGAIENSRGAPLEGAIAEIATTSEVVARVTTNAHGMFVAAPLKPGTYSVRPSYLPVQEFAGGASRSAETMKFAPLLQHVTLTTQDVTGVDFLTDQ